MAPNKKKKKALSNPNRGFATTSIPSKPKVAEPAESDPEPIASVPNDQSADSLSAPARHIDGQISINEMSPAELETHLEDAELQEILNSHGARCRQDAFRQANRLEIERRQLRSQSYRLASATWLSEESVDHILALEISLNGQFTSKSRSTSVVFDENALLLRLWTLKRALTLLKFPDIDDVITHVTDLALKYDIRSTGYIWGLYEALEWYAAHGSYGTFLDYDTGISSQHETEEELSTSENETDDELAPMRAQDNVPDLPQNETGEQESEADLTPISSSESDSDDPASFVDRYVKLQATLYTTKSKKQQNSERIKNRKLLLSERIERLKRDPLFDLDLAESKWRQQLRELEIERGQANKKKGAKSIKSQNESDAQLMQNGREAVDNEVGLLDGIFGLADAEPERSNIGASSRIEIVNFGRWSGGDPRKLLEESLRNSDSNTRVRFKTLNKTSHSVRLKVKVDWKARHMLDSLAIAAVPSAVKVRFTQCSLELKMDSIATATANQSEAYLSATVLFILSTSAVVEQRVVLRLPTVWRNFCNDLSEERRTLLDKEDKMILRQLRILIERARADADKLRSVISEGIVKPQQSVSMRGQHIPAHDEQMSVESVKKLWTSRTVLRAYQEMLQARGRLPVYQYKEEILATIMQHQLIVICADTGAGKSTQVPSFILEQELSNGHDCRILVTQPRRISAISLARRVSQELGERHHDLGTHRSLVGYAIRLESKVSSSTRLTFATSGVLLRMIESSPDLENLDYLILDEVHERTLELDLLFIVLRKLQQRRSSLKIILMSATVDANKFSAYFGDAPVLNVPGRTFPVDVKYLEDAVEATLPLLTQNGKENAKHDVSGDEEEDREADMAPHESNNRTSPMSDLKQYSSKTRSILSQMDEYRIDYGIIANLAAVIATNPAYEQYSSAILIFMPGLGEIRRLQNVLLSNDIFASGWVIHLLHSSFSTEDLERAFAVPPPGQRKIVISTNIAETGVTIPDVTAVIDTCKEKVMRFDERRQLSKLTEGFISRSSARQRKGRAARVREGLCFHLVTKYRYENVMLEQHVPEMLRLSLQDPILRVKIWNLGSIEDILAAAIDPPAVKNVRRAVERLKEAGALNAAEDLTPLGKQLARLPLEVLLGKLAILGIVFQCLDAVVTILAIVSSKSPFLSNRRDPSANVLTPFNRGDSDLLTLFNAYQGWKNAKKAGQVHQYCRKYHLSDQIFSSIEDQKIQLLINLVDAGLLMFNQEERAALNKCRNQGHRKDFFTVPSRYNVHEEDTLLCTVIAMAFYPRILVREGKGWRNVYTNQQVSVASGSVNRTTDKPPKWLSFLEAMQSKNGTLNVVETSKVCEAGIICLLGEAEFKYFSGVISLDNGKVRFCLRQWRQMAAVKAMREGVTKVLQRCWQASGLATSSSDQAWLDTFVAMIVASSSGSSHGSNAVVVKAEKKT